MEEKEKSQSNVRRLFLELEAELKKEGVAAFMVIGDPETKGMFFSFLEGRNNSADIARMIEWLAVDGEDDESKVIQEASLNLKAVLFSAVGRVIRKYPQSFFDLGEHCGLIRREIKLPKSFTEQKAN